MNQEPDQALLNNWSRIRNVFTQSFSSSFHYAIASVNPDGSPHVTPIGSVILSKNEPKGFYFEIFTTQLKQNIERDPRVCVLAVNSGVRFWLSSLFSGKFSSEPGIRLHGSVGARRPPTEQEIRLWRNRIGRLRWLKGYDLLWGTLPAVRDIEFYKFDSVKMGRMTHSH